MLPDVAGLCDAGCTVHFYADKAALAEIEHTGAHFVDLYTARPVDSADAISRPEPIRYVSFAGRYGDEVAREVAALAPRLVLHETFAVIGRVVAHHLRLPRVDVRAGHNLEPLRTLADLHQNVPIWVGAECRAALASLQTHHGMPDASPFSYFIDTNADLNLYPEPSQHLRICETLSVLCLALTQCALQRTQIVHGESGRDSLHLKSVAEKRPNASDALQAEEIFLFLMREIRIIQARPRHRFVRQTNPREFYHPIEIQARILRMTLLNDVLIAVCDPTLHIVQLFPKTKANDVRKIRLAIRIRAARSWNCRLEAGEDTRSKRRSDSRHRLRSVPRARKRCNTGAARHVGAIAKSANVPVHAALRIRSAYSPAACRRRCLQKL